MHANAARPQLVREFSNTHRYITLDDDTVILKYLGLYSRRIGNAGRGLIFDKATQSQTHRLSHAYDVLDSQPSCEHCHELQQPQSEEVVQDV